MQGIYVSSWFDLFSKIDFSYFDGPIDIGDMLYRSTTTKYESKNTISAFALISSREEHGFGFKIL